MPYTTLKHPVIQRMSSQIFDFYYLGSGDGRGAIIGGRDHPSHRKTCFQDGFSVNKFQVCNSFWGFPEALLMVCVAWVLSSRWPWPWEQHQVLLPRRGRDGSSRATGCLGVVPSLHLAALRPQPSPRLIRRVACGDIPTCFITCRTWFLRSFLTFSEDELQFQLHCVTGAALWTPPQSFHVAGTGRHSIWDISCCVKWWQPANFVTGVEFVSGDENWWKPRTKH